MSRKHSSTFLALFLGLASAFLLAIVIAATDVTKAAIAPKQVLRIALIPGNGDRAVSDATTAIVEATLTGMPDVELLEREQIRKILAEQRLSASGLLDPSAAINLGKLIRAEAFLVLERAGEQNISATLLETSTGVSLAAEIFGGDGSPDEKSLRGFLTSALIKARLPANERRYVAIIGIRSEEPGVSLKPLADALTAFLKCDLAKSDKIILLDRNYLQWLTQEQKLTDLQLTLKGSVALIDGGIRRNPDKPGMLASISLVGVDNKPLHHFSFEFEKKSPAELRGIFASRTIEAAGAKLSGVEVQDAKREAATLIEKAHFAMSNGELEEAPLLAEAAFALLPTAEMCAEAKECWARCSNHFAADTLAQMAGASDGDKIKFLQSAIRNIELTFEEWRLSRMELGEKWEGPDYPARISPECVGGPLKEFEITFDLGSGKVDELQKEYAARVREKLEIELCSIMKAAEKTGVYPDAYWQKWTEAVSVLGIQHPGLAERKLPGLRRAFTEIISPRSPAREMKWNMAQQIVQLAYVHMQFSNLNLRKGNTLAQDRKIYIPFFREFKFHQNPVVRTFANLMLLELDDMALGSAIAAIEAWSSLDPDHPCRKYSSQFDNGGVYGFFSNSLASAQGALHDRFHRNDQLIRVSDKLLSPFLRDDSDSRMLVPWRTNFYWWIGALREIGRLNEARELTTRLLVRLSNCGPSSGNQDLAVERTTLEGIKLGLDEQLGKNTISPEWSNFEFQDIKFETPIGFKCAFTCQDGKFYVVSDSNVGSKFTYTLQVFSIPAGGKPLQTVKYVSPKRLFSTENFANIAVIGGKVFVGTRTGLIEFSMTSSDGKLLTEADGLPADPISALAVVNGKLYAAHQQSREIGASGLSVLDPESGAWKVIASSSSKIENPLSNRGSYWIPALFADEQHKCLWIMVENNELWKFFPETGKFERADPDGTWLNLQGSAIWWLVPDKEGFLPLKPFSGEIRMPGGTVFVTNQGNLSLKQTDSKLLVNTSRNFGPAYPVGNGYLIVGHEQIYMLRLRRGAK